MSCDMMLIFWVKKIFMVRFITQSRNTVWRDFVEL